MADPSLELQGAIVARLKNTAAVAALVGQKIYDPVPPSATFPYVSLGPDDLVSDDADCITGFEITVQIDAWSRQPGFKEVKQISDAVRESLHDYDFTLSVNAAVLFVHRITRNMRDPDGLTNHAAMTFTGFVEKPSGTGNSGSGGNGSGGGGSSGFPIGLLLTLTKAA